MKVKELWQKVNKLKEDLLDEYAYVGIRFENKERELGEVCENSRHNIDREDERDFPIYGSEEYSNLEILDGTSCYDLSQAKGTLYNKYQSYEADEEADIFYNCKHCYIVVGWKTGNNSEFDGTLDLDEIVIKDAEVIEILF